MQFKQKLVLLLLLTVVSSAQLLTAGLVGGRSLPDDRDFNIRFVAGSMTKFEGAVQETTRRYYDAVGREEDQADAERFDLNDFGMDGGYALYGLSLENAGSYATFQLELLRMNPKTTAVAKRNYYIGVSGVEHEGNTYENMMIPEGKSFSMDIAGYIFEMRGMITPFTIEGGESFAFTPWFGLGLFVFAGQYDVDAGDVTGVAQYLEPPEDFAIGGRSDGTLGIVFPELGVGGEVRIGRDDGLAFVLQLNYAFLSYEGSTAFLSSTSGREKDINLDHTNTKALATLEFPMDGGRSWTVGVQYHAVESIAEIKSNAETVEEVIEKRERFDKDVKFTMDSITAVIGMTF